VYRGILLKEENIEYGNVRKKFENYVTDFGVFS
jgi:hypothetical protein